MKILLQMTMATPLLVLGNNGIKWLADPCDLAFPHFPFSGFPGAKANINNKMTLSPGCFFNFSFSEELSDMQTRDAKWKDISCAELQVNQRILNEIILKVLWLFCVIQYPKRKNYLGQIVPNWNNLNIFQKVI